FPSTTLFRSVRPLRQITGEAEFNEVYLTGVRVPDADRIGGLGDGWRVSLTTLMNERVTIGGAVAGRDSGPIGDALKVWRENPERHDRVRRDRLARLWIDAEVLRLTNARAAANRKGPAPPDAAAGRQSQGRDARPRRLGSEARVRGDQPAHLRAVHGRSRRRRAALPELRDGAPRRGEPHRRRRPPQDVPPVTGVLDR